jgi:hypothetical protein
LEVFGVQLKGEKHGFVRGRSGANHRERNHAMDLFFVSMAVLHPHAVYR